MPWMGKSNCRAMKGEAADWLRQDGGDQVPCTVARQLGSRVPRTQPRPRPIRTI
jgi:hypothetical protein